ncbi:Similar to hypothetical protein CIMG_03975 [Coccidioides immitis RS]; acc. no. XP_001244534 [Pyronema omphalodes CBS 100304]|uniref:Uncharacterized protein n=1 Tax=Pyronema omphalodes (strain CBS 100304) TaxID=1076935 RepID=U4L5I5_PYROM|nr:Similar to hypothetical protein CIMG_03975 [Coccidioides immitis RS]; acc. no. XP_001244534 [Pyronema omphalodes CBS 100304]
MAGLADDADHVPEAALALGTQKAIEATRKWWAQFNKVALSQRRKESAYDALTRADSTDIKLFLQYRIQSSPTRQQGRNLRHSTVEAWCKNLQTVCVLDTKRQILKETNRIIGNFIKHTLTVKFGLIMERKDKPTCAVADLFNLLHFHWCQDTESMFHGRYRIQVAILMQLTAYTSSRPGAIIEVACYKGLQQVLKYKVFSILSLFVSVPTVEGSEPVALTKWHPAGR